MDCQNILKSLEASHFKKIIHTGNWLEIQTVIYAKQIKDTIFLLFAILDEKDEAADIRALIAQFNSFESIGQQKPEQIMFYLSIKEKHDFHYFKNYIKICD